MQRPDIMRVTADQNPALIEATRDMPLGAKGKADLHFTLKSKDVEGVDLIVEAVVPEGYEIDEDSQGAQSLNGLTTTDALQTPLSMMVRKSMNKGSEPNKRT